MHAAIAVPGNSRKHGRCAVRALANSGAPARRATTSAHASRATPSGAVSITRRTHPSA